MLMIVTSVQERPPFIPEAVHRKKQQMEVDAEPRRLERHIEEEMGDEYILDLQSQLMNLLNQLI